MMGASFLFVLAGSRIAHLRDDPGARQRCHRLRQEWKRDRTRPVPAPQRGELARQLRHAVPPDRPALGGAAPGGQAHECVRRSHGIRHGPGARVRPRQGHGRAGAAECGPCLPGGARRGRPRGERDPAGLQLDLRAPGAASGPAPSRRIARSVKAVFPLRLFVPGTRSASPSTAGPQNRGPGASYSRES
jgi:hypothetical protein